MTQVAQRVSPVESPPTTIERQVAKLEERFAQLKAQVRQAQQLSAMGPAAAVIAHEFNNLLSPVLSYAQYALQEDDMELGRKALRITVQNVRVLKAMSERLLEVSAAKTPEAHAVLLRPAGEDQADAIVRGTITRYDPDLPVAFQGGVANTVDVTRRLVRLTVSVEIYDQEAGRTIWERSALTVEGDYEPGREQDGIDKALNLLVTDIVDGAQSQW